MRCARPSRTRHLERTSQLRIETLFASLLALASLFALAPRFAHGAIRPPMELLKSYDDVMSPKTFDGADDDGGAPSGRHARAATSSAC